MASHTYLNMAIEAASRSQYRLLDLTRKVRISEQVTYRYLNGMSMGVRSTEYMHSYIQICPTSRLRPIDLSCVIENRHFF